MQSRISMLARIALLAVALLQAQSCSLPSRGHAVPKELQDQAVVLHMSPGIRTWGEQANPDFSAALLDTLRRERADQDAAGQPAVAGGDHGGEMKPAYYLAISGGGANGAFGAGLLCGWTAAGNRPAFKLVTGISTGALTAPFAFVGAEYDEVLRSVYTQTATKDILIPRGIFAAIFNDAMADNSPMWRLLDKFVDQKLLDRIAAEHRKGRVLVIGTTNLDAGRSVLWNIGEIAGSGDPGALALVRKIMIASASIPGAFPPVMVDVEVQGAHYQEMHVDGGAMTQVFLYPPSMDVEKLAKELAGVTRKRSAYIIRNSRLDPQWADVRRSTLSILGRAIDSLIQTQGIGDLYRLYLDAQRDEIDFNLAYIPASFTVEPKDPFDKAYMTQLFQVGYDMALAGYPWQKTPPGYKLSPAKKAP